MPRTSTITAGALVLALTAAGAVAGPAPRQSGPVQLTWGSAPHPGSVGSRARRARGPITSQGTILELLRPPRMASVLVFVSTDCPVSNALAPEIQRICADYQARGVDCGLVYEDLQVDDERIRKHLAEYGYRGLPAAMDLDRAIASRLNATITPQAVLVDRHGAIRYRGRINNLYEALGNPRQVITAHDLRDALDAVLAGRPVPNPETKAVGCVIVRREG